MCSLAKLALEIKAMQKLELKQMKLKGKKK